MAFCVCVCAREYVSVCAASLCRRLRRKEGVRRRPGEKENAEANHSQLWHRVQVSCVAPGKHQCQGLLGKAAGFFPFSVYMTTGTKSRYQHAMQENGSRSLC